MNFFFFFIILLAIGVPVAFAVNESNTIYLNATIYIPECEGNQTYDFEKYKCVDLEPPEPPEPPGPPIITSSGSSGGGGGCRPTGVGPGGAHGRGGASGAIGKDCGRTGVGPNDTSSPSSVDAVIPKWVGTVALWWNDDLVTQQEFKNMMTYLLDENIIPNNIPKPDSMLADLIPSTKQIFVMWANDKISESSVIGFIEYHRIIGVW